MRRLLATIAAMLPLLFLAASMQCLVEPFTCEYCTGSVDSPAQTSPGPSQDGCAADQGQQILCRRTHEQSLFVPCPPRSVLPANTQKPQLELRSEAVAVLVLCLAHSWQFQYRAALAPRAPSLVS